MLKLEQNPVCRRFEQLASDVRSQIGKLDGRVVAAETRDATHLGTVDALQLQVRVDARDSHANITQAASVHVTRTPLQMPELGPGAVAL